MFNDEGYKNAVLAHRERREGDAMERRDQRCYCGHIRGNHNAEGMCPLSAIAYQYERFPGDDYCKCQGFVAEQAGVTRFRISTHDNGYYCVSIPNYEGGEVVHAQMADMVIAALGAVKPWLFLLPTEVQNAVTSALAAVVQADEPQAKGGSGSSQS